MNGLPSPSLCPAAPAVTARPDLLPPPPTAPREGAVQVGAPRRVESSGGGLSMPGSVRCCGLRGQCRGC